jgi:predicted  nucleic acid-binding Zn-ribbon protein
MAALKSEAREKAAPDPVVKKAMEQMAAAPDLVRLEAETRARAEKAELDARMALKANKGLADELAAAQERNRQLEEQLSAARKGTDVALKSLHETEDKLAAAAETNARLEATTAALCKDIDAMHHDMNIGCGIIGRLEGEVREAAGLCPGCAHRLDGFCPYPDMVAETYELPDEDRNERHRGRRIVFGRRACVECDLHRPVASMETAAD